MALLPAQTVSNIDKFSQRQCPHETGEGWGDLSGQDLKSAIEAIDGWVDGNAASFNSAIPLPARTLLSAKQKAWLMKQVINERVGIS